jgi:hypothetical protein
LILSEGGVNRRFQFHKRSQFFTCTLAQQEKRREGAILPPRRSLIQATTTPAPWLSYGDAGIWLIDENTQSGWRMIV